MYVNTYVTYAIDVDFRRSSLPGRKTAEPCDLYCRRERYATKGQVTRWALGGGDACAKTQLAREVLLESFQTIRVGIYNDPFSLGRARHFPATIRTQ